MKFVAFFVKRPVTALMLNLFFLGFGIFAFGPSTLPKTVATFGIMFAWAMK